MGKGNLYTGRRGRAAMTLGPAKGRQRSTGGRRPSHTRRIRKRGARTLITKSGAPSIQDDVRQAGGARSPSVRLHLGSCTLHGRAPWHESAH